MSEIDGNLARLNIKSILEGRPTALIVMGVSGSGKTTTGMALSQKLDCRFVEGDDGNLPVFNGAIQ